MYSRVLVPLDGSATALQVLPYAKLIAKATGANIDLIRAFNVYPRELVERVSHQYSDGPSAYPPPAESWLSLQGTARKDAALALEEAAGPLRSEGFSTNVLVSEEDAADAIVQEAEKDPATIVAISTHGRSGIGRWVMGSVTDKVIRQATNPVLVVRAREDEPGPVALKQVILPLDGSSMSETAAEHAVALAKALGTGITLLRSISPMAYGDTFADYVPTMYEDLSLEIDADVRDYLKHEAERIRAQGISDVAEKAVDGYPASTILDEVGENGEGLVVMATHGRHGIGRWVLGSVTDRVMRHSSGPVLVVRPKSS